MGCGGWNTRSISMIRMYMINVSKTPKQSGASRRTVSEHQRAKHRIYQKNLRDRRKALINGQAAEIATLKDDKKALTAHNSTLIDHYNAHLEHIYKLNNDIYELNARVEGLSDENQTLQ